MKRKFNPEWYPFLMLWGTQSLSGLGSSMTSYALVIWSYTQSGSALSTALLSICTYAPYVLMSIFAGALSDRWNKKRTLLVCDIFAAFTTLAVLILLWLDQLAIGHLYLLNALNGLMNTLWQPASEVAITLVTPKDAAQRVGGLKSLSNSITTVLTPACATALLTFGSVEWVIAFDLFTCFAAVIVLAAFIRLPEVCQSEQREPVLSAARSGLKYLAGNRPVLNTMLLLTAINLIASMYNAALPAMVLSRQNGSETVLGWVNSCTGIATLIGGLIAYISPKPKNRIRVIHLCLLFSMSTENLMLALGRTPAVWCIAALMGWLFIPLMNANLDALYRTGIPVDIQGRFYATRNSLQFFTIPLGYLLGGLLVDKALEPLMAMLNADHFLIQLLGAGKGSGAALLFLMISGMGIAVVVVAMIRNRKYE